MVKPEAHHGLPWSEKDWFASKGIDVNDVEFGAWVEGKGPNNHHHWSKAYDDEWRIFIEGKGEAIFSDIMKFCDELRKNPRWGGGF